MTEQRVQTNGGPSAFSTYASRFLSGKAASRSSDNADSQIFRPSSPSSPTHDPFLHSPTASLSHPHLRGSSRSPSPSRTPPFPGPGIAGIPSIADADADALGSGIGVSRLFAQPSSASSSRMNRSKRRIKTSIPNPYAPSSEDEEDDQEADLDEVAVVRRSLMQQQKKKSVDTSERAKKGWLAHQSVFPPSSSSSSEDESDKATEPDSDSDSPSGMMGISQYQKRQPRRHSLTESEPLPNPIESALDEPLLGPDELEQRRGTRATVPIRLQVYHGRFGHWQGEGLRKYKDSGFLALWLASVMGVILALPFLWGSTDPSPGDSTRSAPSLIPLLPLLLVLLLPTLIIPPAFLFLLSKTVRPVLMGTAVIVPFSLFVCGWWAIGASFESYTSRNNDSGDQWWGTVGLRVSAALLWILAAGFGRLVWIRRKRLDRTAAVVELSTQLLLSHPPLLLLTPLLLGFFALTSIPFLTMLVRLGTIGYWRHPRENTWNFHIKPYAGWLIFLVTLLWIWTWGVIRGIGRVTVAAVIGEWYFHRDDSTHADPLETTTAALHRATGTSLGSICLGAGIIAVVRTVGRSAAHLKRVCSPRANILPSPRGFLSRLNPLFSVIASVLDQLNGYALVYVGITGEAFWPSARRAVGLAGKRKGGHLLDYTLIKLLLTLSSTALGVFTGMAGYLYMAHSLGQPGYAPVAALLCGGVPFLAVRAGAAVLGDAADTLFICHQMDRELGGDHCDRAKEAFLGDPHATGHQSV